MDEQTPAVGIFWAIGERGQAPVLLSDLCVLRDGEPYGDFVTHGGHFEYWESLRALGSLEIRRRELPAAPLWSEYEEWPRGRVVYHVPTERFIVYADRKLQSPPLMSLILRRFGLLGHAFDLRNDAHYVSLRSVGFP